MNVGSEFIVEPVLKQLKKYHPQILRYREEQNQNTKRPCFLVEQLTLGNERQMFGRAKRTYRIRITYLCEQTQSEVKKHLREIGTSLLEEFQLLDLGNGHSVFGRDAEFEIVGGELLFTVEFPVHLVPEETFQTQMHNIETNTGLKN